MCYLWKALERDAQIRKAGEDVNHSLPVFSLRHRSLTDFNFRRDEKRCIIKDFQMTWEICVEKDSAVE